MASEIDNLQGSGIIKPEAGLLIKRQLDFSTLRRQYEEVLCKDYHDQPVSIDSMLPKLQEVESKMLDLLQDRDDWTDCKLRTPKGNTTNRLWRNLGGGNKIVLHSIEPAAESEADYHFHQWPSIVHVHEGRYEMGIGYGPGITPPPIAMRMIVEDGFIYEMPYKDTWHYVRTFQPSFSTMLQGPPWGRPVPMTKKAQGTTFPHMDPKMREAMFDKFEDIYSK